MKADQGGSNVVDYIRALGERAAERYDIEGIRAAIDMHGAWQGVTRQGLGTLVDLRMESGTSSWGRTGFAVTVSHDHTVSCHVPTLERAVLFGAVHAALVRDLCRSLGWSSWRSRLREVTRGFTSLTDDLPRRRPMTLKGIRAPVFARMRQDADEIRAAVRRDGVWERADEWKVATFTEKRIGRDRGRWAALPFTVTVNCGRTLTCGASTLRRAISVLEVYDALVVDLYYALGWPSWVTAEQMDYHTPELPDFESAIRSGDPGRIERAAERLATYVDVDDAEAWAVWRSVEPWCRSGDARVRHALARSVLARLLRHDFRRFFPRLQELAMSHAGFAETLDACWGIPRGDLPLGARRRLELERKIQRDAPPSSEGGSD